jgi:hypothetical protein
VSLNVSHVVEITSSYQPSVIQWQSWMSGYERLKENRMATNIIESGSQQSPHAKSTGVSIETAYTAAVGCFLREHDRWNHWMLFFFGLIAAIFVAWQQLRASVPLWAACLAASGVACLWVVAAVNIRVSAVTWFEVARRLELGSIETAFVEQQKQFEAYSRLSDYKATINILSGQTWRSLTRTLIFLVTLVALVLFTVGVAQLLGSMIRAN